MSNKLFCLHLGNLSRGRGGLIARVNRSRSYLSGADILECERVLKRTKKKGTLIFITVSG